MRQSNRGSAGLIRIAILMEGRVAYERTVLRGIRDYAAREAPDWMLRLEPTGKAIPGFLAEWQPAGVLFQSAGLSPAAIAAVKTGDWPSVHVSDASEVVAGVPCVGMDNAAIGKMAAEFLLADRFRQFAFVGQAGAGFSDRRGDAFRECLAREGHGVARFDLPAGSPSATRERKLVAWLKALPKPVALFAVHDEGSLRVSTLCRDAGIRIPEDAALLGVDNDRLICDLAWPKLSSIAVPARRVGFEAARRLAGQLAGRKEAGDASPWLLPPSRVVTRHSTDTRRTEDETVNRALDYLRDHLAVGVNVAGLASGVGVSRRLLERRFRAVLGRSPLQEIQRLRLERARALLLESDLTLEAIAEQCGCRDASQLVLRFRRETGQTPGEFRRQRKGS